MRSVLVFMFVVAILMGFVSKSLAEDSTFVFTIEPMYMNVEGIDEHSIDLKTSVVSITEEDYVYGTKSMESIILDPGGDIGGRAEGYFMWNKWAIGLSGWGFGNDDKKGGVFRPEAYWSIDLETGEEKLVYDYVKVWDHPFMPVVNESSETGYSPITYAGKSWMSVWTTDFFMRYSLLKTPKNELYLKFGARIGEPKHKLGITIAEWAHVTDFPEEGEIFDNRILIASESKADYSVLGGPLLEIGGKAVFGRFSLETFMNQSILFGNCKLSGTIYDIDDVYISDKVTGEEKEHYTYAGVVPFYKKESTVIPVTELSLKLLYSLTENISLGITGFFSVWWDMPISPVYSNPTWTLEEGMWKLDDRIVRFSGISSNLEIAF